MKIMLLTVLLVIGSAVKVAAQDPRRITLMSYNVENLFDTQDNLDREGDNTYLPRALKGTPAHIALCERTDPPGPRRKECLTLDWNERVLDQKLQNLATVIGRFEGRGPDVLLLQEVENRVVMDRLRQLLPDPSGYQTVINLDDSPGRGINVGMLSRLPLDPKNPPVSTPIQFPANVTHDDGSPCSSTRNITSITLTLPDGASLSVFVVHMPAGGPASACRRFVAEHLVKLVNGLPAVRMAVVGGDTNLNCGLNDQQTINKVLRPTLTVPDEVNKGCRPPGSSFFPPQGWSFLDLIMTNRFLLGSDQSGATWFAEFGTFRTVITSPEIQVKTDARNRTSPRPFEPEELGGASDHWPVAIDLLRRR
jgi:hypothetical protein